MMLAMRHASLRLLAAFALTLACAIALPARSGPAAPQTPRIVAIADIHGADAAFDAILARAELTGPDGRWAGGTTVFVQTGDYLDRGTGARAVIERLMTLPDQAEAGGGRAEILLGNHEVMNMLRELTDVTPAIFATFADRDSEKRRAKAYDEQVALARRSGAERLRPASREAWMAAHPPGYVEYVEAFARGGRYGRWLRERRIAVLVDGTVFMHAGLAPDTTDDLDAVNRAVADALRTWDLGTDLMVRERLIRPFFTLEETIAAAVAELERVSAAIKAQEPPGDQVTQEYVRQLLAVANIGSSPLLAPDGPMWYRGLTSPDTEVTDAQVQALLDRLKASRFVLGHTPTRTGRVLPFFGGRVFAIDTGMLSEVYVGGRASALEIRDGVVTAIYEDGREAVTK
jgi:hypothetical protein